MPRRRSEGPSPFSNVTSPFASTIHVGRLSSERTPKLIHGTKVRDIEESRHYLRTEDLGLLKKLRRHGRHQAMINRRRMKIGRIGGGRSRF